LVKQDEGEGKRTEACHCDAGVVDDEVDPVWVLGLQENGEAVDAVRLRDVQLVELYVCETAVLREGFGFLQVYVVVEGFDGFLTTALVARGEVDEEGTVVEGRFGILEGELADWWV